MDLKTLQEEMKTWQAHNFPNRDKYDPILGVAEETGELCHAILKMKQGIRGTKEEHMAAAKDAMADIIIYLSDAANAYDIDLDKALEDTWNHVKTRDWIKFPGDGKKS